MSTIENYCKKIDIFKRQLDIINSKFLIEHISCYKFHELVTYKDFDKNWVAEEYVPILDEYAISQIGINPKNKMYFIMHTDMIDKYLYELISSLDTNAPTNSNSKGYEEIIQEKINEWRKTISKYYNRLEHIKVFVWDLLKAEYDISVRKLIENYAHKIFSSKSKINFSEFSYDGMDFEIIGYNPLNVKLKSITGILGNFTTYGKHTLCLPNQEHVCIPEKIYSLWLGNFYIVEIGKSVFDSLSKTRIISLPKSIKKIDWSFWECDNLERIEIDRKDYETTFYKTIDGVLYTGDGLTLCAYPNNHGESYEIPEGVVSIKKFAFKSCKSIKTIFLPSSLRKIEVNAFYRCTNLERIICNMKQKDLTFDGFTGDFGNVNPRWYFMA